MPLDAAIAFPVRHGIALSQAAPGPGSGGCDHETTTTIGRRTRKAPACAQRGARQRARPAPACDAVRRSRERRPTT